VNWVTFDPIAPTAETILGAFMAGAILSLLDRDEQMTHPAFRRKLEAVGFGIFIPVFFVASGVNFDLDALLERGGTGGRAKRTGDEAEAQMAM
jgi:Kef-type K+ transport system membrane component KefB